MSPEIYKQLETLATTLSVPVEHIYKALLIQSYIHGFMSILAIIVACFIMYVIYRVVKIGVAKEDSEVNVLLYFCLVVSFLIFSVFTITHIKNVLTYFLTPDYGIVLIISDLVK